MSGCISRMRRSTKTLYDSRQPTERQRKWSRKLLSTVKTSVFGGDDGGSRGGRFNKGDSYRDAGAGAGAGGRWTLHGNQRHSATGKRRDEHNWFKGEKPQLNKGCFASSRSPSSFSLTGDCLTTPRLFPQSAPPAHAQLAWVCQSRLTVCVLDPKQSSQSMSVKHNACNYWFSGELCSKMSKYRPPLWDNHPTTIAFR